ncbi:ATP-binding protein [Wenyingzhuangia sp. IMCC45533]
MIKKITLFLFFLLLSVKTPAQNNELSYYKSLNISNGLTHNGVTSIFKDSKGFVWIATYDGLNRYDGYRIKQFKNSYQNKILNSNRVRIITENDRGELLLGTDRGLTVYNIEQEKFTKLYTTNTKELAKEPIIVKISIHPTTREIVCSTEGDGIYIFDKNFKFKGQYQFNIDIKNKKWILNSILLDKENYLFVTTFYAIIFNINTKKAKLIKDSNLFDCTFIKKYDGDTFYVGNSNGGLTMFDFKLLKEGYVFQKKAKYLNETVFNCSNVDYKNQLWLGTAMSGATRVSSIDRLKNNKNYSLKYFKAGHNRLRVSSIVSFDHKYAWIGSYNKGVFLLDLKKNPFYTSPIQYDRFLSIVAKNDYSFYTDRNFNSSKIFNIKTRTFEKVKFDAIAKNNFRIIYVDSKGNTWGVFSSEYQESVGRVKKGSSVVEKLLISKFSHGKNKGITEDPEGNIWLTYNKDVFRINIDKNQKILGVEDLSDNPSFAKDVYTTNRFLYADPVYDYLWIGDKTDGLIRITLKPEEKLDKAQIDFFTTDTNNPKSLINNFVTSVLRLPNKDLWIGTEGGGISKVLNSNSNNPEFIAYTEKDGLSNNVVKSILADSEQNLWITTNKGLNKFDIKTETFRNFTKDDGLPFEDFYFGSQALGENNFVLVGSDSFCYFNSKEIVDNDEIPSLEFGELSIYNSVVKVNDTVNGRVLLNKRLSHKQTLTLNSNENVFSLEVIPLHYSNNNNYPIQFKLEPLNKEWISLTSGQNIIEFNGLQSGNYTLRVKAANSLNQWTAPKMLYINVKPKFWKSNTAYTIYVLLGFIIMYLIFQIFYKIQKLNHTLEIEQLEIDNIKDINESKLKFFANITHEIKTPIALISGPVDFLVEKIKNGESVDILSKLNIVKRQSNRISELIDQVRDFQQSDRDQLKMEYESFCFDDFIKKLSIDFEFLAKKENKKLTINNLSEKRIYVKADKDKVQKVFNNLFSNSFKYTKSGDNIILDYRQDDNSLIVSFRDTGKGIAPDDLPYIFERFYQSKRMTKEYIGGSGIGLAFSKRLVEMHYGYIHADSELGVGTTIHLDMPIVDVDRLYENHMEEVLHREEILEVEIEKQSLPTIDLSEIKFNGEFSEARIFYAEDNVELRNFVEEILANFFKVTTFTNGAECLAAMQKDWPDIVLTDVLMPELNGFELCREIKNNIKTSHIPVVMLTACISDEEQIQGINEGVDAYIKKPFNNQRLVSTIESLLRNRQVLKERFKADFPLELEKSSQSQKDVEFIEGLYKLMTENLDNKDLDMDQLAKQLYLNRTHFYQKVKTITGQTPFELLKDFRIKKAAEFLVRDKLTVNEVFIETGFKSRSHFSKVFKDKYGVTPGQYVNKGLEEG